MSQVTADPASELAAKVKELEAQGIRYFQIEVPDLDAGLRGKAVHLKKGLSPGGGAFCKILFGLTTADDVYESPLASFSNGFPDFFAHTDTATVTLLPWRTATAAGICDLREPDGALSEVAPRTVLRRVVDRCTDLSYEPRFAIEYEAYMLHADDELMAEGRHHELKPFGRTWNAYSLVRMADLHDLATEFMARMDAVGAPLDSVHSELGYGLIEFALAHAPALDAADRAARAKAYLKELCAERGLVATFMAKWKPGESGSGGHAHQSLWRDGENAFAADDGSISELGRRYAAGQMATMRDFTALFNPTVNSYRRIGAVWWSPENASWGGDNRTAALRVITAPGPGAVRIEHRRPGADASPHLCIAAMLAGGIHGIEEGLEPAPYAAGNAAEDPRFAALPADLDEATTVLEQSGAARRLLGDAFVDHFVLSRREEWRLWDEWSRTQVTEWELRRYFETI